MDVIHRGSDTGAACVPLSWQWRGKIVGWEQSQSLTTSFKQMLLLFYHTSTIWSKTWSVSISGMWSTLWFTNNKLCLLLCLCLRSIVVQVWANQISRLWSPSTWAAAPHWALHGGLHGTAARSDSSSLQWDFCTPPHRTGQRLGPAQGQAWPQTSWFSCMDKQQENSVLKGKARSLPKC